MGCGCSQLKREEQFVMNLSSIPLEIPRVLLLGLDGSGKSCLFYRMKIKVCLTTEPTNGYNVDIFSPVKGLKFTMWDIGGQASYRKLWSNYYAACRAVLFMVDSSDHQRWQEARGALQEIMSDPAMPDYAPLLVIANKQDKEGAAPPERVAQLLDIHQIHRNHQCRVIGMSVIQNVGVLETMVHLKAMFKKTEDFKFWA